MTRKLTSHAEVTPVRVVIVTLDTHLASVADRARETLMRQIPGLEFSIHAASEWEHDPEALQQCRSDIERGDIILASMLFLEDHFKAVLPWLTARRDHCDAMIGCMSAGDVIRLTRLGRFTMNGTPGGAIGLLKRLRGGTKHGASSGAKQMKMLRRLPQILRFIPGPAQDVRAYFLTLQYWLAGSEENVVNMVQFLIDRYADGPRRHLRGTLHPAAPAEYPENGLYHPRISGRITDKIEKLPVPADCRGTVGILVMRSYVLAGNTAHYDGVIGALEARGLRVIPTFATGLDSRPAVNKFFFTNGKPCIDAFVSLNGFSLVGGPAYNDSHAAEEMLAALDVPHIAAHPLEFQSLAQWEAGDRGLMPVEATMMVAIPELDGSTGPIVYGGRPGVPGAGNGRDMQPHPERAQMLASRVERLVQLRKTARDQRKIAVVLFNFPPNAGNTGTAAFLSVFASLHRTLKSLCAAGYAVEVPPDVDSLRRRIVEGNAAQFGSHANVHTRISANDHVRRERWLREIEAQWGAAPGRQQSDGSSIFVLGARFGNVFVGIQPAFGYEGDPMRLLFEKGFAPTHAFSAFYRYLREDFGADAVLHFGTHGALEFMPGKQVGLSERCWPDRLIDALPNIYLYAANNPSEGMLAKRRSAATLVSYLTPPIANAGLYRGLLDLKASLERWRNLLPDAGERDELATLIQQQAADVDLADATVAWEGDVDTRIAKLHTAVLELEYTLVPYGLHEVGKPPSAAERIDMLLAVAEATHGVQPPREAVEAIVSGAPLSAALAACGATVDEKTLPRLEELRKMDVLLAADHEIPALLRALDGCYIRPAPGGDLLRTPAILPTGRNLHGFDPFRIPSAFAIREGARQAQELLEKFRADGHAIPATVAIVLWGTDNLKTEGGPIAQALALLGARPHFDAYGRLAGAELIALAELGRPRIDVLITVSGIFRDLLPLQMRLLAEAALLAAQADEPPELNLVRKHALEYQQAQGCDLETAALRVFGNADGAYGANVGNLIESGRWSDEAEIAETYTRRKCFAYGRSGRPLKQPALLRSVLQDVELTYQNLDSVEVGVTTINMYFDTLGGIATAAKRASGATGSSVPVYIGDQTRGRSVVRTLGEQVALETRTRTLNPKWYEEMLKHGYEGVRTIEEQVTNTLGWSATTGKVAPWVYQRITETFVLDPHMRERLATLNPTASAKMTNRLLEAHARHYWTPDDDMLDALRRAGEELEDRLEGVVEEEVAA
jgi:magnesium chelatase subunit H